MNSQLSSLKYKELSGRISVPEILAVVSSVPRMRKPSQPISLILPVSGRRGKRYQLSLGQPLIDRWNRYEGRPYKDRFDGFSVATFPATFPRDAKNEIIPFNMRFFRAWGRTKDL
jgi:hypothetical protein